MQNRQKHEISRDILTVCNGGSSITKVMFHGYMTHGQAKAYLSQLVAEELVVYDQLEGKYYTTPKGLQYLTVVETMTELFPVATKRSARERLVSPFL